MQVIGAGFGRTGTLSLKFALEKLGFNKCYHMMEVFENPDHRDIWSAAHRGEAVDWDTLFAGYEASVDWPSCNLWREQLAHFPDAKVLLSLRDPERWYDSVMNTIYRTTAENIASDDPMRKAGGQWAMDLIWQPIFDNRMDDRKHVIECFKKHNKAVMDEVPAENLLIFEASQGWTPLCDFLDVPVPDEPYPRVNTTEQFNETWEKK